MARTKVGWARDRQPQSPQGAPPVPDSPQCSPAPGRVAWGRLEEGSSLALTQHTTLMLGEAGTFY